MTMIFSNNHQTNGYHSPDGHDGCILKGHLWAHGADQNTELSGDFVETVAPSDKYMGRVSVSVLHVRNILDDIRHSERFCYPP